MKTLRALPTGSRGAPYDTIANRQVFMGAGPAPLPDSDAGLWP